MDPSVNPYASPMPAPKPRPFVCSANHIWTRALAWLFVGFSVACALAYTYIDEIAVGTRYGAWPLLFLTSGISIVAAVVTHEPWIAPLSCFIGTVSGDLLAAILVNWGYAQMHLCLPLALGFSAPALIVAALLRANWKRTVVAR